MCILVVSLKKKPVLSCKLILSVIIADAVEMSLFYYIWSTYPKWIAHPTAQYQTAPTKSFVQRSFTDFHVSPCFKQVLKMKMVYISLRLIVLLSVVVVKSLVLFFLLFFFNFICVKLAI